MRAIIRQEYQDGKIVYQVLENGFSGQNVEFSSEDAGACEKYCENYYGEDWGWV